MHNYVEAVVQTRYKCVNCKKMFDIPYYCTEWGYWYAGRICCGYSCMRAMREKELNKQADGDSKHDANRYLTAKEVNSIETLILKGFNNDVIAKRTGRSKSTVINIRRRMVQEGWITKR